MINEGLAASRNAKIINEAKAIGVSPEMLMRRYVFERFLVRLGRSEHREKLVLKGAMALVAVTRSMNRITRDMDMLGLEKLTPAQALGLVKAIAASDPYEADAVWFDLGSFTVEAINARAEEPGHQIKGMAKVGNTQIPLKIEISHGHTVTPAPMSMRYPTVLEDTSAPDILCYTPETILAEKFEAITSLGTSTSRFKDFYDVRELGRKVPFNGIAAAAAFQATFGHRETELPTSPPASFLPDFHAAGERGWQSFMKKQGRSDPQSFADMIAEIEPFVMHIATMARDGSSVMDWEPGNGWVEAAGYKP